MDKYEFNLKMEQMKKLIHEEDYGTALKIVESIDWNRVRNINLLTMAATVYEKNDMLSEARDVLHLALDRAPVGKRILYKLAEIAVRMGSLDEAEDYSSSVEEQEQHEEVPRIRGRPRVEKDQRNWELGRRTGTSEFHGSLQLEDFLD